LETHRPALYSLLVFHAAKHHIPRPSQSIRQTDIHVATPQARFHPRRVLAL